MNKFSYVKPKIPIEMYNWKVRLIQSTAILSFEKIWRLKRLCMLLTFSSYKDLFFRIWIGEYKFPTFARNWDLISFCLKTYHKLSPYPVCFRTGTACFFDTDFNFILSSVLRRQVFFASNISIKVFQYSLSLNGIFF